MAKSLAVLKGACQKGSSMSQDGLPATAGTSRPNATTTLTSITDEIIQANPDTSTASTHPEANNNTRSSTQTQLYGPTSVRDHLFSSPHLHDLSAYPTLATKSACIIS